MFSVGDICNPEPPENKMVANAPRRRRNKKKKKKSIPVQQMEEEEEEGASASAGEFGRTAKSVGAAWQRHKEAVALDPALLHTSLAKTCHHRLCLARVCALLGNLRENRE